MAVLKQCQQILVLQWKMDDPLTVTPPTPSTAEIVSTKYII